jgi:hypothetical protein
MTKLRRFGLAVGLIFALLLAGLVIVRVALDRYLKGDSFRQRVAAAVGRILKAEGTFAPVQRVGGTLYSDQFIGRGSTGAFFSDLRADRIRADVEWRGLLHRTVQIDALEVQKLDVSFATPSSAIENRSARSGETPSAHEAAGWKVELRKANIAESTWRWRTIDLREGRITGTAFTLTPSEGSWIIEASSGKVAQQEWPELSLDSAKLRYTGSSLFVNEALLRTGAGRITVTGEVAFRQAADLQALLDNLPLTPFLPNDWRLRLTGNISGTTKIHAPFSGEPVHVEGNVRLINGQVEALPLLDQIAKFTRTERFRKMALTNGSLTFTRDKELITAKDIVVESEGLMRIEGACTIMNEQIDGLFQVGVTAASLQWLPGSQAHVFTISHDGYFWTSLRLSGPVAHPTEDLTPRLAAAAANQILDSAQDVLRDAAKSALDLIPH